jgi:hypothetical protein
MRQLRQVVILVTAAVVCLTVLSCRCLNGQPLQQRGSIMHLSFMNQYTSVTHDALMPYVDLQRVIRIRLFYAAILIRMFVIANVHVSPCCHSLSEYNIVVEKIVLGTYLKSWGLGECYTRKFRKSIVFCWRLERKCPRFIRKCSANSNDFQEWLKLTT